MNVVSKAGVTPWLAASGHGDRLGGVLYNKEGAEILRQTRRGSQRSDVPARRRTSAGEMVTRMDRRTNATMMNA